MSLFDALLLDPYRLNVWIAYRTDGVKGSGTENDPFDGSTATRLDTVLNSLVANTRIHFGPGTFQINGYQDGAASSWLRSGMAIIGSGIDITTLQMAGAVTATKHYFAIGHPFSSGGQPNLMDYVEVSDLTINCNLSGAGGSITCGAVRIIYLDGAFQTSPAYIGYGIQVNGAKNLLVRNNVIEAVPSNAIRNNRCGSVKYFNDKTPPGVLTQGWNAGASKKYDELETDAEDAFVLALMKKR